MSKVAQERITTRVSLEAKELLEKGLLLSGYSSLNSFIANAAVAEAKRLIEQNMRIHLCQEDVLAFINLLEKPVEVNDKLMKAIKRHKETISNADSDT